MKFVVTIPLGMSRAFSSSDNIQTTGFCENKDIHYINNRPATRKQKFDNSIGQRGEINSKKVVLSTKYLLS